VRRVFLVRVSLEELPISPEVRAWIDERVAAAGHVTDRAVAGMQVFAFESCDVSDLAWLELLVEQTRHVPGDLYARKQRRPEDHGQSFANFGYLASGIEMASPESRLRDHAARWEALSEAARRYFRAHAPDDEPDDP
jgi:anti-sigma factor RsiW